MSKVNVGHLSSLPSMNTFKTTLAALSNASFASWRINVFLRLIHHLKVHVISFISFNRGFNIPLQALLPEECLLWFFLLLAFLKISSTVSVFRKPRSPTTSGYRSSFSSKPSCSNSPTSCGKCWTEVLVSTWTRSANSLTKPSGDLPTIAKPPSKTWPSSLTVGCSPIANTNTTLCRAPRRRFPTFSVSYATSARVHFSPLSISASKSASSPTLLVSSSCSTRSWRLTTTCTASSSSLWWIAGTVWENPHDFLESPSVTSRSANCRTFRGMVTLFWHYVKICYFNVQLYNGHISSRYYFFASSFGAVLSLFYCLLS